jgi:hypothetical protein
MSIINIENTILRRLTLIAATPAIIVFLLVIVAPVALVEVVRKESRGLWSSYKDAWIGYKDFNFPPELNNSGNGL